MSDNSDPLWIAASEAMDLMLSVYGEGRAIAAAKALAKRAHGGLVETRARLFKWEEPGHGKKISKTVEWAALPEKFWWAEGSPALSQNWILGDFSTWVDQNYNYRAFGVEFSRRDIEAMLPVRATMEPNDVVTAIPIDGQPAPQDAPPLPSNQAISAKMQELVALGMSRDVAAKVIRQIAGFERVGNELARSCVAGQLPVGRPKGKRA